MVLIGLVDEIFTAQRLSAEPSNVSSISLKNIELLAMSRCRVITRSLLKLRLICYYDSVTTLLLFLQSRENHLFHRSWIEPFPRFLASHNLKMKLGVVKTSSDHSGQRKIRNLSVFLVLIFLLFQNFSSSVERQLVLHLLVS